MPIDNLFCQENIALQLFRQTLIHTSQHLPDCRFKQWFRVAQITLGQDQRFNRIQVALSPRALDRSDPGLGICTPIN